MSKDGKDNDNGNEYFFETYGQKTVFNHKFLKIKMFIVMEITLRQKYRWHETTGESIDYWKMFVFTSFVILSGLKWYESE